MCQSPIHCQTTCHWRRTRGAFIAQLRAEPVIDITQPHSECRNFSNLITFQLHWDRWRRVSPAHLPGSRRYSRQFGSGCAVPCLERGCSRQQETTYGAKDSSSCPLIYRVSEAVRSRLQLTRSKRYASVFRYRGGAKIHFSCHPCATVCGMIPSSQANYQRVSHRL